MSINYVSTLNTAAVDGPLAIYHLEFDCLTFTVPLTHVLPFIVDLGYRDVSNIRMGLQPTESLSPVGPERAPMNVLAKIPTVSGDCQNGWGFRLVVRTPDA